jgi:hypothetical protein
MHMDISYKKRVRCNIVIPHWKVKKQFMLIYVITKEMWSVVDLSHIENLRKNSCEYRLYIIISYKKN